MESFLRLKRNWTARSLTIVVMLSMVFWAHPQAWGLTIIENGDDNFGDFETPFIPVTFQSDPGANTYSGTVNDPGDPSDFIKIGLNGQEIVSGFVRYDSGDLTNITFQFFDYTVVGAPVPISSNVVDIAEQGDEFGIPQFVLDTWNGNGAAEIAIIDDPGSGMFTIGITNTPEPSTLLLLGSGLAGLVAWRMRKGRA